MTRMSAATIGMERLGNRGLQSRQTAGTFLLLLPALIFLGGWFIVPIGQLFLLSFDMPGGALASYGELLGSTVFRQVFVNTLILAVVVTAFCVLLACPAAYLLSRARGFWFTLALYCVLAPFWISVLVRTFSWMLLLERNGPVNTWLMWAGVTSSPLPLLFNYFSVCLGMIHVLLPYAVLPIYSAMLKVDRRLLQASEGLGASGATTFLKVYLPLILPGILAGATFVFLLALGFYITPALLGGGRVMMLAVMIEQQVHQTLNWAFAAALSAVLLAVTLLVYAVAQRFNRTGAEA